MTEKELKIIMEVATEIAPKYLFPGYEKEDMIQEGILIGIQMLGRRPPEMSLERFLRNNIKWRLIGRKYDIHRGFSPQ